MMSRSRWSFSLSRAVAGLALCASLVLAACGGPRHLRLADEKYPRRPRIYPIEIFVGEVAVPYREVAVIESTAFPYDDDETRLKQIEELKRKARRLGADAVQEMRILTKDIKGFTIDERTPFPSWRQGDYELYFMRGKAIVYESSLPGSVARRRGFSGADEDERAPLLPPVPEDDGADDADESESSESDLPN